MAPFDVATIEQEARQLRAEEMRRIGRLIGARLRAYGRLLGASLRSAAAAVGDRVRHSFPGNQGHHSF